jgi:hypothetical protein
MRPARTEVVLHSPDRQRFVPEDTNEAHFPLFADLNLRPSGYELRGILFLDRTRSGFSGLLGSFGALLGPPSFFHESSELLDFAGESSTLSVAGLEPGGRFNSPRLHQNSLENSGLFPKPPKDRLGVRFFLQPPPSPAIQISKSRVDS